MAKKGKRSKKEAKQKMDWDAFKGVNKFDYLFGLLIVVLGLFVYSGGAQHEFVHWDDNEYVFENDKVMSDQTSPSDFFKTSFSDLLAVAIGSKVRSEISNEGIVVANYHPVTMVSLWMNWQSGSGSFAPFFQTNKWIHILNALLVYLLVLRIYPSRWVALFSATMFAVHPMHVESVAWASERKDVLYTFFFLMALGAFDFFLKRGKMVFYVLALLLFILSCLSKPAAVIFPLIAFGLIYLRDQKLTIKRTAILIPFFALSLFFGLITLGAQAEAINDSDSFTFFDRLTLGFWANAKYLMKFFLPRNFSTMHPVPGSILPMFYVGWFVSALFFGLIAFLGLTARKTLAFGLAFYFFTIVLVLQFLGVGSAIIAERYTYVPYIGLSLTLLVFLHQKIAEKGLLTSKPGLAVSALLAVGLSIFALSAKKQVGVWKDSNQLWGQMIEEYPNAYLGYKSRGYYLSVLAREANNGDLFLKAIQDYDQAIPRANMASQLTELHTIKGYALFALGRDEESIIEYTRALEFDSDNQQARSNRGVALVRLGRYNEALPDLKQTIDHPEYAAQSLKARSVLFFSQGQYQKAIDDVDRYLLLIPTELDMMNQKGVAHINLGEYQEAIQTLSRAIDLTRGNHPSLKSFYRNRALAYQQIGMVEQATQDINRANKL